MQKCAFTYGESVVTNDVNAFNFVAYNVNDAGCNVGFCMGFQHKGAIGIDVEIALL